MIGLGGYGGSYMDDVEDDIILNGGAAPPTSSPVQLIGGFAGPSSSMPPPSTMNLHHVHQQQQQQQMSLNAAVSVHHSHHDMDDPRIANLLLKNGNGFSQSSNGSNFGFHQQQHQQLPYNPQQQQQATFQLRTFQTSYGTIITRRLNTPSRTIKYCSKHKLKLRDRYSLLVMD
jgi:hypothetical protein